MKPLNCTTTPVIVVHIVFIGLLPLEPSSRIYKILGACMIPTKYLTVDENIYPMRNKISFKVYNKSKLTKHGLLFKSLISVDYSHISQDLLVLIPVIMPTLLVIMCYTSSIRCLAMGLGTVCLGTSIISVKNVLLNY